MEIGAVHPGLELGGTKAALTEIATSLELMGLDHLTLYDHVLGAEHEGRDPPLIGYATEKDPFNDPLVAFSYLAALTSKLKFVTGVLVLPQRQTALVAKQSADLDLLCDGRLTLGVGLGWNYVEYEALGQDYKTRGKRMDQQIGLLRKLWSERIVSFEGEFDRIDRAGIWPQPGRQIPILCGGGSEPAYARGAKLADGFLFFGPADFCLSGLERVRHFLDREGRASDQFALHYVMQDSSSSAEKAKEDLSRWRDTGGSAVSINSMGRKFETPAQHLEFIDAVRR